MAYFTQEYCPLEDYEENFKTWVLNLYLGLQNKHSEWVRKQWSTNLCLSSEGLLLGNPAFWLLEVLPFTPCPSHCFRKIASFLSWESVPLSDYRWGNSMLFCDWGWNNTKSKPEKGCSVGDIRSKWSLTERQKNMRAVSDRKRSIKPRGWKNGMEGQKTEEEEFHDLLMLTEETPGTSKERLYRQGKYH